MVLLVDVVLLDVDRRDSPPRYPSHGRRGSPPRPRTPPSYGSPPRRESPKLTYFYENNSNPEWTDA